MTVVPRHANTSKFKTMVTFNYSAGLLSCGRSPCHGMCEPVCEVRGQAWVSFPSPLSMNIFVFLNFDYVIKLAFSVLSIFLKFPFFSLQHVYVPIFISSSSVDTLLDFSGVWLS